MTKVATPVSKIYTIPKNWAEAESFSRDHLFDAYLKGKEDGKGEMMKILSKQFKDNLDIATKVSERLLKEAKNINIELRTIHLRADSITKFSALYVADSEDFVSDNFRKIFTISRKIKNEIESESFYISFSFMPFSKSLNTDCISSDGYFLKYVHK